MDKEEKEFIHIRLSSFGEGEERKESEPDKKWSNFNCLERRGNFWGSARSINFI